MAKHLLMSVVCVLTVSLWLGCSEERRSDADRAAESATGQAGQAIDDATLTARVKAQLAMDEGLRTITTINVDSDDGVVRLSGTVPSEEAKQRAERAASQADGVRTVRNNLKVEGTSY